MADLPPAYFALTLAHRPYTETQAQKLMRHVKDRAHFEAIVSELPDDNMREVVRKVTEPYLQRSFGRG